MGNSPSGLSCSDCKQCETECDKRIGWVDASDEYYDRNDRCYESDKRAGRPNLLRHIPALSGGGENCENVCAPDYQDEQDYPDACSGAGYQFGPSSGDSPHVKNGQRKSSKDWDGVESQMEDHNYAAYAQLEAEPAPEPLPAEFTFDLQGAANALKALTKSGRADIRSGVHDIRGQAASPVAVSQDLSSTISIMNSPRKHLSTSGSTSGNWPLAVSDNTLEFDELHLEYMFFNPCVEPLKTQLLQKMGLPHAEVDAIRGRIGGCNAGMWVLKDIASSQSFMMKLVRVLPAWIGPSRSPESEKYATLSREHPEMINDLSLSFPCKVFHCLGKGGSKTHDLVVMRWVPGVRFSEFIMQKLYGGQVEDLMRALHWFGNFLADFHERYNGLQHGDLTPANVFVDEETNRFTLVDVADIAPRNPVIQSDVDRFVSGLDLLSNFYGKDLWAQGKARFEAGYKARQGGMQPSPS